MMDQIRYIAPEISLLCFALIVVVLDSFIKPKKVLPVIAVAGSFVALLAVLMLWGGPGTDVFNRMIAIDDIGGRITVFDLNKINMLGSIFNIEPPA